MAGKTLPRMTLMEDRVIWRSGIPVIGTQETANLSLFLISVPPRKSAVNCFPPLPPFLRVSKVWVPDHQITRDHSITRSSSLGRRLLEIRVSGLE